MCPCYMQDSKSALQIARKQREHGCLPKALSLWAVSNPLRDSPDSVLRKVPALLSAPHPSVYSHQRLCICPEAQLSMNNIMTFRMYLCFCGSTNEASLQPCLEQSFNISSH